MNLSSLSSPNSASSYALSTIGAVDGSISYLYSSLPLRLASSSTTIPLRQVISGYRQLQQMRRPDDPWSWEIWHGGRRVDRRDTLLYGRMYLPTSLLEALYLRRISPTMQVKVSCVSSSTLPSGGTVLMLLSRDQGKHSQEYLYSTDSALLGFRALYNFGPDPRPRSDASLDLKTVPKLLSGSVGLPSLSSVHPKSRLSLGAEAYYGVLNKSGGLSCGLRFTTLPTHTGFPYTMTVTLNPLMGALSSTYSVRAGKTLTLCSRFDFNVYSYDSGLDVGVELWRPKITPDEDSVEWAQRRVRSSGWNLPSFGQAKDLKNGAPAASIGGLLAGLAHPSNPLEAVLGEAPFPDSDTAGVLKARVSHTGSIALLWEGRAKDLLYSCGIAVDLRRREHVVRGVGLEVQYSR